MTCSFWSEVQGSPGLDGSHFLLLMAWGCVVAGLVKETVWSFKTCHSKWNIKDLVFTILSSKVGVFLLGISLNIFQCVFIWLVSNESNVAPGVVYVAKPIWAIFLKDVSGVVNISYQYVRYFLQFTY